MLNAITQILQLKLAHGRKSIVETTSELFRHPCCRIADLRTEIGLLKNPLTDDALRELPRFDEHRAGRSFYGLFNSLFAQPIEGAASSKVTFDRFSNSSAGISNEGCALSHRGALHLRHDFESCRGCWIDDDIIAAAKPVGG
ncbi:hypothetical protein ASF65_06020 [Aureimonas sp. Leaf324]|nr:hypothetical protein ASF65_06020 [Aureimonas sp. Leaf324]